MRSSQMTRSLGKLAEIDLLLNKGIKYFHVDQFNFSMEIRIL